MERIRLIDDRSYSYRSRSEFRRTISALADAINLHNYSYPPLSNHIWEPSHRSVSETLICSFEPILAPKELYEGDSQGSRGLLFSRLEPDGNIL